MRSKLRRGESNKRKIHFSIEFELFTESIYYNFKLCLGESLFSLVYSLQETKGWTSGVPRELSDTFSRNVQNQAFLSPDEH